MSMAFYTSNFCTSIDRFDYRIFIKLSRQCCVLQISNVRLSKASLLLAAMLPHCRLKGYPRDVHQF